MSSVIESSTKSQPLTVRFLLRSSSIQKIKCSAVYLSGFKMSKNAIIELLEANMIKSRNTTHIIVISCYIGILNLISTLLTWVCVSALQQISNNQTKMICDKKKKAEEEEIEVSPAIFFVSLRYSLNQINIHKNDMESRKLLVKTIKGDATNDKAPIPEPSQVQNLKCITETYQTDLRRLSKASELSNLTSSNSSLHVKEKQRFKKYCFILCVHFGLIFMYSQILFLAFALNTTNIPFGLVFMITTIALIGYIIFQIMIIGNATNSVRQKPLVIKYESNHKSVEDLSPERHSRLKRRKIISVIDLNSKTLSKIKLL